MNQKLLIIFIVGVFVLGGLFYIYNPEPVEYNSEGDGPEPIFCAQDAKLCPNGIYVGRTGPNCEFVCPEEEPVSE